MFVQPSGSMKMPMDVRRLTRNVRVKVAMEMKPFFPEVKQDAGPERNEHGRDAKFEPATKPIRYVDLEENDKASGQGKR